MDGDGEREVVCTVDGEWEGPGPWLQVSQVLNSHVGCYLLVLDGRRGTYEAELVRMVWFAALRAAGDVDNDGRDELALFHHLPPPGRLESLLQVVKVDRGGLVTVAELPVEGWTGAWLVDVTGDGRPELLVGFCDTLTAYRFQGGEAMAVWRVKGWPVRGVLPVDRDGDGVVDALVLLGPRGAAEVAQGVGGLEGPATVPVIPVVPVVPRVRRGS